MVLLYRAKMYQSIYLGIKFKRTLSFKQHLEGIKDKMKTCNNIISKLTRMSCDCKANVLSISHVLTLKISTHN